MQLFDNMLKYFRSFLSWRWGILEICCQYKIQPSAGKLILTLSGIHKDKSGALTWEGHNN